MENLVRFFLKRKVLVHAVMMALFLLGPYELYEAPKNDIPPFRHHEIVILSSYPSGAADVVEQKVTFPIEETIGPLVGKEKMVSVSKAGLSLITIEFGLDSTLEDVQARANVLFKALQTVVLPPRVRPILKERLGGDEVMLEIGLTGGTPEELQRATLFLQTELVKIAGVVDVLAMGTPKRLAGIEGERWGVRYDGVSGAGLLLHKELSADTLKTISAVKQKLFELQLPPSLKLHFVHDRSVEIAPRLLSFSYNILLGLCLAICFLWVLFDRRVAFWATGALFVATMALCLCGITLNIFTLSAIVVALGLMFNGAMVIAEKIYVHKEKGMADYDAATSAVGLMWRPLLIIMAAASLMFAPLVVFSGTIYAALGHIMWMVMALVFFALVDAYFILPMQILHSGKQKIDRKPFVMAIEDRYEKALRFSVKHRYETIFFFLLLLLSSGYFFVQKVELNSFPLNWSRRLVLQAKFLGPETRESAHEKLSYVESHLKKTLGTHLASMVARTGTSDPFRPLTSSPLWNEASVVITLNHAVKPFIIEALKEDLEEMAREQKSSFQGTILGEGPSWRRHGELFITSESREIREETQRLVEKKLAVLHMNRGELLEESLIKHLNGLSTVSLSFQSSHSLRESARGLSVLSQMAHRSGQLQIDVGGEIQDEYTMVKRVCVAFGIVLMGLYLVMALMFNSFRMPFLALLSMPFMSIGLVWSYYFIEMPFTFFSTLALLGLLSFALSNGLMLIHTIRVMQEKIQLGRMILIDASVSRLRPMLATTFSTLFCLLPLSLGIFGYDMALSPMCVGFSYGLLFTLLVLLFLIPCLYEVGNDIKSWRRA